MPSRRSLLTVMRVPPMLPISLPAAAIRISSALSRPPQVTRPLISTFSASISPVISAPPDSFNWPHLTLAQWQEPETFRSSWATIMPPHLAAPEIFTETASIFFSTLQLPETRNSPVQLTPSSLFAEPET